MIRKKMLLLLFIGIFGMFPFMTGCINLDKAYPEKRYFALEASRDEDMSSPDTGKVLTVRRFRVSPKFEGKGLVYRLGELSYEADFYNEFFISPSQMLTEEVRKRLARSGLFKQVLIPSSLLDSTYILEGAVTAFYGDYRVSTAPKAVMEIQFFLLEETAKRTKIIYQSRYYKEEPFKTNMPDALVKSWNVAFNQILTEFETDLKEFISKTDP
jgi:cholesterol transport system auxiliary component